MVGWDVLLSVALFNKYKTVLNGNISSCFQRQRRWDEMRWWWEAPPRDEALCLFSSIHSNVNRIRNHCQMLLINVKYKPVCGCVGGGYDGCFMGDAFFPDLGADFWVWRVKATLGHGRFKEKDHHLPNTFNLVCVSDERNHCAWTTSTSDEVRRGHMTLCRCVASSDDLQ